MFRNHLKVLRKEGVSDTDIKLLIENITGTSVSELITPMQPVTNVIEIGSSKRKEKGW